MQCPGEPLPWRRCGRGVVDDLTLDFDVPRWRELAEFRRTERGQGAALTNKGKLVRDKISQIIRAQGGEPIVRVAAAVEYRELLRAKLAEEVGEVLAADDADAPE